MTLSNIDILIYVNLDTFKTLSQIVTIITISMLKPIVNVKAVICRKQISVEGDCHCCHRPSSNWET